jgi:hypothetical protein
LAYFRGYCILGKIGRARLKKQPERAVLVLIKVLV